MVIGSSAAGVISRLLFQVRELDVFESYGHFWPCVGLERDDPFIGHFLEFAFHHSFAVDFDGDFFPFDTKHVIVEFLGLDDFFDHLGFGCFHHAAEFLAIETAPVLLADIALWPSDDKLVFLFFDDHTADLYTTIADAIFEFDFEAEFKVGELLFAAQECIELNAVFASVGGDGFAIIFPNVLESFPVFGFEEVGCVIGTCGNAEAGSGQKQKERLTHQSDLGVESIPA